MEVRRSTRFSLIAQAYPKYFSGMEGGKLLFDTKYFCGIEGENLSLIPSMWVIRRTGTSVVEG